MKRNVLSIILVLAALSAMVLPIHAEEAAPTVIQSDDGSTVTYFDDGSTLTVSGAKTEECAYAPMATSKTVSSSKDVVFKDDQGNVEWKYTLYGTFSYVPGVSSTCTSASYTQKISEGNWTFSDGSATRSGNKSYGKGTYVLKFLFINYKTYHIDISLTCDVNGKVT